MSAIVIHLLVAAASIASAICFGRESGPFAGPLAAVFVLLAVWQFSRIATLKSVKSLPREKVILKLGGFAWTQADFCRGWLITGETGSGKTQASINTMIWQVTQNCPDWGGVFIDDKGLYWETLYTMFRHLGREQDLILLQVRPEGEPEDWVPPETFNMLDDPRLPWSAKAKDVCDVAAALGQDGDQAFFKVQAEIQMDFAFRALAAIGEPVTLEHAFDLLTSESVMASVCDKLKKRNTPETMALLEHHKEHIASQPPEQLGGVRGTLTNRLKPFTSPDIVNVFCPSKSSVSITGIDRGKVICVSIPQRFRTERRYINTLLKLTFYSHVLLRFDRPSAERTKDNLLILWADEAQKIVTANEDGTSDYNVVDVIREAKATVVAATQSCMSLFPPMGDAQKAKVFIANMANRVTFKAADEESAKIAAETLGKKKYRKRGYSYSGGKRTTTYTEEDKYHIEPYEFRRLKKFEAVVQHCEKGFCRIKLPPLGADGKVPEWFR
jgi:hypothetical protein